MEDKPKERPSTQCPECGKPAHPDLAQWPPKVVDQERQVHYLCADGHKFVKKLPLK